MLFFMSQNSHKRGDELSRIERKATEERFYLKREEAFQISLKIKAAEVVALRTKVDKWYAAEGDEILPFPLSAKYPISPNS